MAGAINAPATTAHRESPARDADTATHPRAPPPGHRTSLLAVLAVAAALGELPCLPADLAALPDAVAAVLSDVDAVTARSGRRSRLRTGSW